MWDAIIWSSAGRNTNSYKHKAFFAEGTKTPSVVSEGFMVDFERSTITGDNGVTNMVKERVFVVGWAANLNQRASATSRPKVRDQTFAILLGSKPGGSVDEPGDSVLATQASASTGGVPVPPTVAMVHALVGEARDVSDAVIADYKQAVADRILLTKAEATAKVKRNTEDMAAAAIAQRTSKDTEKSEAEAKRGAITSPKTPKDPVESASRRKAGKKASRIRCAARLKKEQAEIGADAMSDAPKIPKLSAKRKRKEEDLVEEVVLDSESEIEEPGWTSPPPVVT